jgi:hypothetical protein
MAKGFITIQYLGLENLYTAEIHASQFWKLETQVQGDRVVRL